MMINTMRGAKVGAVLLLAGLLTAVGGAVWAAQIQSLSWQGDGENPVLRVQTDGDAPYSVDSLEGGQRLRISFRYVK